MSKQTKYFKMTGFVDYAKVFAENMDDNMDFHGATQGQFNMNFYPETEEEMQKFFDNGAPQSAMGHDTIKIGDPEIGMGKYFKLKRPNVHKSGIDDFGGPPKIFDFREGESVKQWDYNNEDDGEIGSRSKVIVEVSIWGTGGTAVIRLEKIAVLELNKWEKPEDDGIERF